MNIIICDPHPIMAEALTMLIRRVVPEANIRSLSARQAHQAILDEKPDLLVVDPLTDLCSAAYLKVLANLELSTVVFYDDQDTRVTTPDHFHRINKSTSVRDIEFKLRELLLSPSSRELVGVKLSKRQKQLFGLLDKGMSNKDIAVSLNINEHTVKVHLWRLYKRIGVNSRTQALTYARTNGWL
jgi:DNA-binding NarL/FixJ family response regulator